ncbi:DUF3034 family protein [Salinisphaera sp.]|uniref:DUF3034 family protein n=1 Tax=Salinisphaera sp. TaxID=1914330 RepID=UPI000C48606E|nr:DUF3034 family protein [Salinisphaera sp.]MAS09717.1 hypothetical protein [Salinisphaera sp.]
MTAARRVSAGLVVALLVGWASYAHAVGSRLWATGGVTNINGAAGGGITTWAVLNGYASDTESTVNVAVSSAQVDDFGVETVSIGFNWANRLAVTVAQNRLSVRPLDTTIRQQTIGLKLRLAGEALYDRFGQYSAGMQYTHNADFGIPALLGARDSNGIDFYLAASKVFLAAVADRNVIVNATLRATRANQLGLLGFGSARDDDYALVGEFSAGVFLDRRWLLGAEYRQKPDNLEAVAEDDWKTLYLVYAPSRLLAFTLAYVDLGRIAGFDDQDGYFLSLQSGF